MCDRAAEVLCRGIRLLGNLWQDQTVGVVPIGGVARSAYVKQRLAEALARSPEKRYHLVEPQLSPIAGAVLLALERHGIIATDPLLARLHADPHAAFGG
jgi:glucosamine kinase